MKLKKEGFLSFINNSLSNHKYHQWQMIKTKRKKELLQQVKMLNLVFNKHFKYQIIGTDLNA